MNIMLKYKVDQLLIFSNQTNQTDQQSQKDCNETQAGHIHFVILNKVEYETNQNQLSPEKHGLLAGYPVTINKYGDDTDYNDKYNQHADDFESQFR